MIAILCWLEIHNGFVTAIATAVIAAFTFTIWRVARKQLKLTRETERAYLSAAGLMSGKTFTVSVANNGKTPGELTAVAVDFCNDDSIPSEPDYKWHVRRRDFSPGEGPVSVFQSTASLPDNFTRPLVYGAIKYQDIWGKAHVYGFVFRVHRKDSGIAVAGDIPESMPEALFLRT